MKKLKHIAVWIVISIVIQFSILYYLDKYYLKPEQTFQAKKIVQQTVKKQETVIKIPSDAQQVSISYDGNYAAYIENGNVNVVNVKNGQVKTVSADKGNKISVYKWLCDRARLFIAEKPQISDDGNLILNYYDASKDVKNKIEDITYSDNESEVQDIEVAPMTNVVYMKIYRYGKRSDIYSSNAMNDIKKIKTITSDIGNIKTLKHKDELIYEDSGRNRIYSSNDNNQIVVNGVTNPVLIGVDSLDNVYVGNLVNNKIDKIYYGNVDTSSDKWKCLSIDNPCDKNDLYVSGSGNVYVNYGSEKKLKNLITNNVTKYKGTFILMTDVGVFTNDGGKLKKNNYK